MLVALLVNRFGWFATGLVGDEGDIVGEARGEHELRAGLLLEGSGVLPVE